MAIFPKTQNLLQKRDSRETFYYEEHPKLKFLGQDLFQSKALKLKLLNPLGILFYRLTDGNSQNQTLEVQCEALVLAFISFLFFYFLFIIFITFFFPTLIFLFVVFFVFCLFVCLFRKPVRLFTLDFDWCLSTVFLGRDEYAGSCLHTHASACVRISTRNLDFVVLAFFYV